MLFVIHIIIEQATTEKKTFKKKIPVIIILLLIYKHTVRAIYFNKLLILVGVHTLITD